MLTDKPNDLLDHLEHCALTDADGNASVSQLTSDLVIPGSEDALDPDEQSGSSLSDQIEAIVDATFAEAEDRIRACTPQHYPFHLQRRVLLKRDEDFSYVYTFLLGLSLFGETAVESISGAKLFEEVCGCASQVYFGSADSPADSFIFGFPRRIGAKDFCRALEELCLRKIEDGKPDRKFPTARTKKDAGLDIVTWRSFPDRRTSKMIAFGQCATGRHWWGKRHELQPNDWCRTWMTKSPQVIPIKTFFVPHSVPLDEWAELGYQSGIIFDRFRISYLAEKKLSDSLRDLIQKWSKMAFAERYTSA